MTARLLEIGGERCLVVDADDPAVRDAVGARGLIEEAMNHRASMIVVPVSRLGAAFFRLRSGLAGEVLQKASNYGFRFVSRPPCEAPPGGLQVPQGPARRCCGCLLAWRDRFRHQFEPEGAETPTLFLNSNGKPMNVNSLQMVIGRTGVRAGIPRVHAHLLRHTFATNYLVKEVGDPLRLQQILGHTSLEMVRRYVALANVQQSLIERRASPMDLIAGAGKAMPHSRRVQPRRRRGLHLVK